MRTLFEISEDLHFLDDFLSDAEGDVSDETLEAEIDKWLADLGDERDTKIDNYCALVKEFEARAEARAQEVARMKALVQVDVNAAARLKDRLHQFLKAHNIQKLETRRFKLARQANGGKLPILIDQDFRDNPEKLPEECRRVRYEPDMGFIGLALDAGAELSWARYGERGEHLRIK